jgi:hypothetical protein
LSALIFRGRVAAQTSPACRNIERENRENDLSVSVFGWWNKNPKDVLLRTFVSILQTE